MSEFNEVVARRRSVRAYDATKPVSKEELEELVKTAMEAPSWGNFQVPRNHIVTTPEMMEKLRGCMAPVNAKTTTGAQALIVNTYVKGKSGFHQGVQVNELGEAWGAYDAGLQNAFLLLKASEMGLDSIVLGLRDADKIKELLSIPENEAVVSIIAIGHRVKDAVRPKRKALEEIAKFY